MDEKTAGELPDKIRAWMKRTGYALEMRVAQEAWKHRPVYVDQSRSYVDPTTEKIRETDVVVAWGLPRLNYWAWVYVVIECKAKPSPWVIFDAGEGPTDDVTKRWNWAVTGQQVYRETYGTIKVPNQESPRVWDTLLKPSAIGNTVVEVAFDEKTKPDRNPAWDAVRAAVSATHGVKRDLVPRNAADSETQDYSLAAFPIVVTSGLLFRSHLRSGEVVLEQIERGEVLVRPDEKPVETRCLIVTEAALPQVLKEAAKTCEAM